MKDNMKTNDVIHGFRLKESRELKEIRATMRLFEFEKTRTPLLWLDRDDENKTFAIAFRTVPTDDTGVFHILEHSVLNGSEKYPVKEPFVELLKSSLQTFLNAFTFPDKTMYPVSSRNDKDLLNLIDVYMDAVLHPLSKREPLGFMQEGWHYEIDDGGNRSYNGVVFNEMKGAYASEDTVLEAGMNRLLFPDTCYRWESGGHPEHITELTYENYLAAHDRFYHPSNARIVLDGSVDLESVLAKLESFLSPYDAITPDGEIAFQKPVAPDPAECRYEIAPDDDPSDKAILARGWVFASYDEPVKIAAASILSSALCGTNESPLKKALMDEGLAQDVELSVMDGIRQEFALLVLRNLPEERLEEAQRRIGEILEKIASDGLDRARLEAITDHWEYVTREKDFGSMPRGLVYAIDVMESWLYGGDPAQELCQEKLFGSIREMIKTGGFEKLLREIFIDCPHRATLRMLPSSTLGEEKRLAEKKRLDEAAKDWTDADVERIRADFKRLRAFQEAPDTPEKIATLPVLSLSDVSEKVNLTPQTVSEIDGVTVLEQDIDTDGIVYADCYFSLDDMSADQLSETVFFASLLGQAATEKYDPTSLFNEIDAKLGHFEASCAAMAKADDADGCKTFLTLRFSFLESKKPEVIPLIREITGATRFDDRGYIYNLLRQARMGSERQISTAGNRVAALRASASLSAKGAALEAIGGVDMLRWLQDTDKSYESGFEGLSARFEALKKKIFSRRRLILSVTGAPDRQWEKELIESFGTDGMGEEIPKTPKALSAEGLVIPAEIGFAARAGNLARVGEKWRICASVASQILTYGYLWNTVRVKGGAYGTRISVTRDGSVTVTSYRDPSPAASLDVFMKTGEALREFCLSDEKIDKYIISTFAESEPLFTPRMKGVRAAERYILGITPEELAANRKKLLSTAKADLEEFSRALDKALEGGTLCVVGGKNVVDACGDKLDSVCSVTV